MASEGITFSANFEKLEELRTALKNIFSKQELAAVLQDSLEIAIWPAFLLLQEFTPRGPTGNLRSAVAYKTKAYPRDGNAVGLVGYIKADKGDTAGAPHQWLVERGTKPRQLKFSNRPYQRRSKLGLVHTVRGQNSYIASSFRKRGGFKIATDSGDKLTTNPASPQSFFRKVSSPGQLKPMPAGGAARRPPLQFVYDRSLPQVTQKLESELTQVLNKAVQKLPVPSAGSL